MTIVFIENVWGGGQIITVAEAFNDHVVSRHSEPGDSVLIAVSRLKSISNDEQAAAADGVRTAEGGQRGNMPRAAWSSSVAPDAPMLNQDLNKCSVARIYHSLTE